MASLRASGAGDGNGEGVPAQPVPPGEGVPPRRSAGRGGGEGDGDGQVVATVDRQALRHLVRGVEGPGKPGAGNGRVLVANVDEVDEPGHGATDRDRPEADPPRCGELADGRPGLAGNADGGAGAGTAGDGQRRSPGPDPVGPVGDLDGERLAWFEHGAGARQVPDGERAARLAAPGEALWRRSPVYAVT